MTTSSSVQASQNKTKSEGGEVFRFHMPTEPPSLDPARLTSTDASYLFHNLFRGLYRYSAREGLVPDGAKSCEFESPLRLRCRLNTGSLWSDGRAVIAEDYVRAFRHLASPVSKGPGVEALSRVKNALRVHRGEIPPEQLGAKAEGTDALVIDFEAKDPEFLFKLASTLLVPIRDEKFPDRAEANKLLVNGPYKLVSWTIGKRIRLEPNETFKRGEKTRPPVEVIFVDEDETALSLYEKGSLSFLRRLPTHYIPKYKSRPDFVQIPVARFDYVGFGPELKDQPDLRAALSLSLKFDELARLYDALGVPGCPSFSEKFVDRERCLKFDLEKAKAHWARVPDEIKKKRLRFAFSRLGGDDIKRGVEWFQAQWLKNLGLRVDLEQTEQGVYLASLRESPPPIFRKGVGLDRPTCLAALETFAAGGSENFIRLQDPVYNAVLERLAALPISAVRDPLRPSQSARKLCGDGVQALLDRNLVIPLGRIHFTLLASPRFEGWSLNELNQLDLASLKVRKAR